MNKESAPSNTLEDLVAQLANQIKNTEVLTTKVLTECDEPCVADPERFRKFEQLLARALGKSEIAGAAGRLVHRLAPEQRDCNHLLIELITNLFEVYRELAYKLRDLANVSRPITTPTDLQHIFVSAHQKLNDEVSRLKEDMQLMERRHQSELQILKDEMARVGIRRQPDSSS